MNYDEAIKDLIHALTDYPRRIPAKVAHIDKEIGRIGVQFPTYCDKHMIVELYNFSGRTLKVGDVVLVEYQNRISDGYITQKAI